MVGMRDRRLAVFTYPVHFAPSLMRLKSIFAKDACDYGASISRGALLVSGVLTGVRIVFSSTANILYRKTPPTASDTTLRVEKTRLIGDRIHTIGLHAGSKIRSYTGCPIS